MAARASIGPFSILAASLALASPLGGQVVDPLGIPRDAYVRVRLTGRPPITLTGRFARSDSIGLHLGRQWNATSSIAAWETVRQVDIRVRRRPSEAFSRGARVGAIVSGTLSVAAVVAAVSYDLNHRDCGDCYVPASLIVVPGSYLFTIAGTLLGGVVAIPLDYRWQRVWP